VLEDDVSPSRSWEEALHDIVDDIESQYPGKYVLALYTAHGVKKLPQSNYVPYPAQLFFGLCAMYYPDAIRSDFANYLEIHGVNSFKTPHDLLLGKYSQDSGIPIFAAMPCLFQHVGELSTGLSESFYQASCFENPTSYGQKHTVNFADGRSPDS
jgi:hypothetical protein